MTSPVLLHPLTKGAQLARYVTALLRSKGDYQGAGIFAEHKWRDTPAVAACLKAGVAGGDPSTPGWSSELVAYGLAEDFVQAIRARTVVDRLTLARRVPFRLNVPVETTGTDGAWVGAGVPIPVSKSAFVSVALDAFVAGVIVVLTNELLMSASPAAVASIQESLIAGVVRYQDRQFLDPSVSGVANVSPGAITAGATEVATTGSTASAMANDIGNMVQALDEMVSPVWIMAPKTIATMALTLGLPDIKLVNGSLAGIPILCTKSSPVPVGSPIVPHTVILLDQDGVLLAEDGMADVQMSSEATIQQTDSPTDNAASGVATTQISLYQANASAARVTRRIAWKRTAATRVAFMEVSY